jgi:REP element-mobilizing transposase RayT/DNA-binding transcriptional ArsR family regulator
LFVIDMSNSSNRKKDYETIHHLTSRIAHKVRFLQDESERNELLEMIHRTASFTGIKLIGWCVMNNHFHILVYLPLPATLSDEEIVRRYGILKGHTAAQMLQIRIAQLKKEGEPGEKAAASTLEQIRARMYSIGSFMKIVKQWFSEEYNRRTGHVGTLWEGPYHDRVMPLRRDIVEKCLGYIHLNPIRAAASATFDGYKWSSYHAFKKGDPIAVQGMQFLYDIDSNENRRYSIPEITAMHEELLDSLLEENKRRVAEEIAAKRAAGFKIPDDPLTDDAMILQAKNHIEEVQKASINLRLQRELSSSVVNRRADVEAEILSILQLNPGSMVSEMAELLNIPAPTLYRYISRMRKSNMVEQIVRGRWRAKVII